MTIRAKKEYLNLRGKLRPFEEEPEYQELVDNAKLYLLGTLEGEHANINRLAALFANYEDKRKALYAQYTSKTTDVEYEINIYKKALSKLLEEAMGSEYMDGVTLSSGDTVYLDAIPVPKILNKDAAIEWLMDEMPEMLTLSFKGVTGKQLRSLIAFAQSRKMELILGVHGGTLNAFVREECTKMAKRNYHAGMSLPPWVEATLLVQAKLKRNGASHDD